MRFARGILTWIVFTGRAWLLSRVHAPISAVVARFALQWLRHSHHVGVTSSKHAGKAIWTEVAVGVPIRWNVVERGWALSSSEVVVVRSPRAGPLLLEFSAKGCEVAASGRHNVVTLRSTTIPRAEFSLGTYEATFDSVLCCWTASAFGSCRTSQRVRSAGWTIVIDGTILARVAVCVLAIGTKVLHRISRPYFADGTWWTSVLQFASSRTEGSFLALRAISLGLCSRIRPRARWTRKLRCVHGPRWTEVSCRALFLGDVGSRAVVSLPTRIASGFDIL